MGSNPDVIVLPRDDEESLQTIYSNQWLFLVLPDLYNITRRNNFT